LAAIRFKCPNCSTNLSLPGAMAGHVVECRQCGNPLLVPAAAPAPEEPAAPAPNPYAEEEEAAPNWWEDLPPEAEEGEAGAEEKPAAGKKQETEKRSVKRVWNKRVRRLLPLLLVAAAAIFGGIQGYAYYRKPPDILWEVSLGPPGSRTPMDAAAVPGGILLGGVAAGKETMQDAWVALMDASGKISWERFLGGDRLDAAQAVTPTVGGGFAATGRSGFANPLGGGGFLWVASFGPSGTLQWQNRQPYYGASSGEGILPLPEGLFVAGWQHKEGTLLTKSRKRSLGLLLANDGSLTWRTPFPGYGDETICGVGREKSGALVLAGFYRDPKDTTGLFLSRLKPWGEVVMKKAIPVPGLVSVEGMAVLPEGGFALAGCIQGPEGDCDVWVARLDQAGELAWQTTLGGPGEDHAHDLALLPDGGLAVAGEKGSKTDGESRFFVVRFASWGWKRWEKAWGTTGRDRLLAVDADEAGRLVAVGTSGTGKPQGKVFLLGK